MRFISVLTVLLIRLDFTEADALNSGIRYAERPKDTCHRAHSSAPCTHYFSWTVSDQVRKASDYLIDGVVPLKRLLLVNNEFPGRQGIALKYTIFFENEKQILLNAFNEHRGYPSKELIEQLTKELGMSLKVINTWFVNERQRQGIAREYHIFEESEKQIY